MTLEHLNVTFRAMNLNVGKCPTIAGALAREGVSTSDTIID
jgi:hypothetical protein